MRALPVLIWAGLVTGCTGNPPPLNTQRDPILGGSAATAGQFPTVVAIVENQVGSLCTGTLVSSTAVLTAAHCVDPALLGRTAAQVVQETVIVFDSLSPLTSTNGLPVSALEILENPNHPDFAGAGDVGHDDDAIIILAQPITDRMPSQVDLDPTHVQLGVQATHVGFGVSALSNNTPDQSSAGVEYFVTNQTVIDCGSPGQNANLLCFDQTNRKGQCSGDSGGPAFAPNGDQIGVVSFGDQNCIQFGDDTRPSQTAAFIRQYVPNINSAPVCGNGLVEYGEQCDAGSANGGATSTCSATCATVTPAVCGNQIVESGEACDDGASNGTSGDPCTTSCTMAPGGGSGSGGNDNGSNGGGCSTDGAGDLRIALLLAGLVVARRRRRYERATARPAASSSRS